MRVFIVEILHVHVVPEGTRHACEIPNMCFTNPDYVEPRVIEMMLSAGPGQSNSRSERRSMSADLGLHEDGF